MADTRVVGAAARKIGGGARPGAAPTPPPEPAPAPPRRSRSLLFILLGVLVAALGAAAVYFFLLQPSDSQAAPVEPEPEPGVTVAIEPLSINLAEGRYLRLGFAVQLVAEAGEINTAQAADIAIELFSGRAAREVNDAEQRAALKDELTSRLVEAYDGEVLAVYLTDYVTQ